MRMGGERLFRFFAPFWKATSPPVCRSRGNLESWILNGGLSIACSLARREQRRVSAARSQRGRLPPGTRFFAHPCELGRQSKMQNDRRSSPYGCPQNLNKNASARLSCG